MELAPAITRIERQPLLREAEFPDWSGIEAWLTQFVTGHFAAQRHRLGPILALKER